MPAINQDLLDRIIRYQIDLRRMDRTTQRDITRQLLDMRKELIAEISSGEIRSMTQAQARKVISNISEVLVESYSMASAALDDGLNDLAQMQVSVTQKQLESTVFVETSINLPSEAAVNRVTRNVLIEGGPLADWWNRQEQDTLFKISNVIREGILLSETNDQIIRKVVGRGDVPGILETSRRNAAAIVQTAVNQVNNDVRQLVYERNGDIIKALVHFSTLDSRTSEICIGRSGLKWKNDAAKTPIGHSVPFKVPPVHWNCLPGDSIVSSTDDVTGVSKRWFDGKMIVINTASGRKLSSTPNHPILTDKGWVKSGSIYKGCNVISSRIADGGGFVDGNRDNMPTKIHDFSESFLASRGVVAMPMPVSSKDFHGDGAGSEVAIVYSDSFLRNSVDSARFEHIRENVLVNRLFNVFVNLLGSRSLLKSGSFGGHPPGRFISFASEFLSLFGRGQSHSCNHLFATGSSIDSNVFQSPGNSFGCASDAFSYSSHSDTLVKEFFSLLDIYINKFSGSIDSVIRKASNNRLDAYSDIFGDCAARHARGTFLDNVVSVNVVDFHGYVYNIETKKGWYIANGIVTHNCRSVIVPETLTFEEMGVDLPEPTLGERASDLSPVSADTSFDDYLKRVPADQVDDMLGVGRAELWRQGKITTKDLLDQNGRPLTLAELKERHA